MKKNQLRKMKKPNPSVFKETWRYKQIRLKKEEQDRLDKAVVRKDRPVWRDGEIVEWQNGEVIN